MSKNLQAIKQRFEIIGNSNALDQALDTAIRVAATDLSVLITGESGVGKEVFSKIIHALSSRKHSKFIAINCGAIPEGTINSELFGHEKGAFTGATSERKGYFEAVNGGTIFLDEIGEMPPDTQAFLLRVLESGEFLRVGSSKVLKTDVRVIAATNVSLEERVKKGKFREDLYYRLNTVPIKVPALRERGDDILMLFRKFALDFAENYRTTPIVLEDKAQILLKNYSWRGNVRELKNMVQQLSVLSEEKLITAEMLMDDFPQLMKRNLPMIREDANAKTAFEEREILYNLLFEMKKDLNDLKSVVYGLIQNNNLSLPESRALSKIQYSDYNIDRGGEGYAPGGLREDSGHASNEGLHVFEDNDQVRLIIEDRNEGGYQNTEEVEENLSLMDMEKELIRKALKKHKGRRKDAATELGISERTLYRKIKDYDLK